LQQPFLAPFLRENEFLPCRDHRNPLLRRPLRQRAKVEAVEQAEADLVFLDHCCDGYGLVDRRLTGAPLSV
jgi:hypothetical protein